MQLKHLGSAALAAAGLVTVVAATPAFAASLDTYVSATGADGNTCTFGSPCQTFNRAISQTSVSGTVHCLGSEANGSVGVSITQDLTIDCSNSATGIITAITITGVGTNATLIGLTLDGGFVDFKAGNSLQVINCRFHNSNPGVLFETTTDAKLDVVDSDFVTTQFAIAVEPGNGGSGPSGRVRATLKNVNITNTTSTGINFQPAASVIATLQNVSITKGVGGGIKANSANGAITLDIVDSVIGSNTGNGLNALGNGQNLMVSISRSTIAGNGATGVQANGATAAIMVDTTLLDSNGGGSVSAINGGHVVSYGNNRIVGSAGTGFSSTVGTQ